MLWPNAHLVRPLRKKLHVVAFMLLAAFSFAALELHADHGANAKVPVANHCCIQCCPSHHLAPAPEHQVSIGALASVSRFVAYHSTFYSTLFPSRIDRPPIA